MFFGPAKEYVAGRGAIGLVAAPPEVGEAGAYLTDGHTLYRVVAPLHWAERQEFALLEDCATLDVFACTADELWETALRVVVPELGGHHQKVSARSPEPGGRAPWRATVDAMLGAGDSR